jgi:hypothetical protein
MKIIFVTLLSAFLVISCNSKPKVIEAADAADHQEQAMATDASSELHKVNVEEVLQTSRYTYLSVTEGGEPFWIAIPRKEVEPGGPYYYRGGLKKVNFKSVEHDRVFETVYLVSDISKDPGMAGLGAAHPHMNAETSAATPDPNAKIEPPPGGITIAELFKNRDKYAGQTIRVRGRCVKINNMIMNRNWVHLQDDSVKDGPTDLTVTTTESIQLGSIVAMEGKITLNKDFGAGYKYEIIMEEAHLLQ